MVQFSQKLTQAISKCIVECVTGTTGMKVILTLPLGDIQVSVTLFKQFVDRVMHVWNSSPLLDSSGEYV